MERKQVFELMINLPDQPRAPPRRRMTSVTAGSVCRAASACLFQGSAVGRFIGREQHALSRGDALDQPKRRLQALCE